MQRCHLCHLPWCFLWCSVPPQQAHRSWMGCGDHCPQFLVGTVMAVGICKLVWFLSSVSRLLGIQSVVVSICCCIPASSVVDKLFLQPKITSSGAWTMKTLPTLVFSKRGTKGPKALSVCFMSLFLEKANPQCFQISVLKWKEEAENNTWAKLHWADKTSNAQIPVTSPNFPLCASVPSLHSPFWTAGLAHYM